MNDTRAAKLEAVRAKFAGLARGERARVVIHTSAGDEIYEVRKAGNGRIVWERVGPARGDGAG